MTGAGPRSSAPDSTAPDSTAPDSAAPDSAAPDSAAPDSTAVRVALWRAMHVQVDSPPHVLADEIGLKLAAPDGDWRARPDMDPRATSGFRASIVARARLIQDLVAEEAAQGVDQYVVLGAGLDTFVQREPEIAARLTVYEVDQPGPQAWKRQRLIDLGYGIPDGLRLVPVDLETDGDWPAHLAAAGFDATRPAVVASTGVTMYLSKEATAATLRQIAGLAPGSTVAMTFLLPPELLTDDADRAGLAASRKGAQASNTPFISFYTPGEMLAMARKAGFQDVNHISGTVLAERYFTGRTDGLRPSSGEDVLVAST
ncbi:methyltransferase, TIGR00027 family [Parafrankia irregularis]|uniref:S-adenosyl-L-methionine-dependent methyltransferase n=1 Tax=Parafrankia irregularis TaxID=795642 RepID=A0A0S4QYE1_9ACTN|nr:MULTISPECIES: class I SAM-dependent methyltransferase [Parafrankia]CUU60567.1 methyltransferase, TIGR00027 family [Parafrankia irregularis]